MALRSSTRQDPSGDGIRLSAFRRSKRRPLLAVRTGADQSDPLPFGPGWLALSALMALGPLAGTLLAFLG